MNTEIFLKENPNIKQTLDIALPNAAIKSISLMAKGSTNRSYLVETKDISYVLRVPGAGADEIIDRYAEKEVYRLISGHNIGDKIVYLNPENGHKVSVYYENCRHMDPKSENDIRLFVKTVRSLHELRLKCSVGYDFFENIESYEGLRKGPSHFADYDKVKNNLFSLKDFIEKDRDEHILIHNDLSPENCLFVKDKSGEESCLLIDFEYSAMQSKNADIAYFCVFSDYNEEETDRIISFYYDGEATASDYARVYAYIALNGLVHSNWLEFKTSLGEDRTKDAIPAFNLAKLYYKKTIELI